MNKIEDIEMIGLVIVEQSNPVNKIGITALGGLADRGVRWDRAAGRSRAQSRGIGDSTCGRAPRTLDLI